MLRKTKYWIAAAKDRFHLLVVVRLIVGAGSNEKGTPQGGVISPLLANLFMHYAFDNWVETKLKSVSWCRYADDGLIHCTSRKAAESILRLLSQRMNSLGLELHPEKTRIAYCKDDRRTGSYPTVAFDFLGYTFRPRRMISKRGVFLGYGPGISRAAQRSIRQTIRKLKIRHLTSLNLFQIANLLNPKLRGWIHYYGKYHRTALYPVLRHLNKTLVRWAQRKYKKLHGYKTRASELLHKVSTENPNLFYHWEIGINTLFA